MQRRLPGLIQRHAALRTGQQDPRARAGHGDRRRRVGLRVALAGQAGGLFQLLAVGGDQQGAPIAAKVAPLGIDDHALAASLSPRQDVIQHAVAQNPLAIVRQDQDVVIVQRRLQGVHQLVGDLWTQAAGLFPVHPHQLLLSAQIAGLDDGHPLGPHDQTGVAAGRFFQHALHQTAGEVVADHGDQPRPAAQGGDIGRHIGRPAQHMPFRGDVQHRHRRLGRDAADRAQHVMIQHGVAADRDPGARKRLNQLVFQHVRDPARRPRPTVIDGTIQGERDGGRDRD